MSEREAMSGESADRRVRVRREERRDTARCDCGEAESSLRRRRRRALAAFVAAQ